MLKISVYIPCYNVEKYIAQCIEAILAQTYPIDEILIIDDGCKDSTIEIASQYPVQIIKHEQNKGLAAGRNTAFKKARNDLVAALDADCLPDINWLETLIPFFDDEQVAWAGGRLVESVINSVADRWRKAHMTQDWGDSYLKNPPFMFGNNSVIRKSVVETVGWYDETLRTNGEDGDLSTRIRAKGYDLVYEPNAVVNHLRCDSISSLLDTAWRYWKFGGKAYFNNNATIGYVLWNLYHIHYKLYFRQAFYKDWQGKNYELLWLDLCLPIYMGYRDFKLVQGLQRDRTRSQTDQTQSNC